ncbi:hypothetical protein GCM10010531_18070 [Blastococcus jejuensis]|uniref:PknH-like extracellular domain-containing protein n=1 Tax=Blastococcus jejuensis TaxID=351224 RepID=A0ABP6P5N2_9ACTN
MRTTRRLLSCAAVALLAACGSVLQPSGDLAEALVVELPGYVAAAPGQIPLTLCDPLPSGTGPTPPPLSGELGEPAAAFYQTAPATLEAYAWRASAEAARAADPDAAPDSDEEAARLFVEDARSAAAGCEFELFTDADTDGDGMLDTGTSDVQSVEPWSGSGWEGVRIHRVVSGQEQTDRRLVYAGDVVLLVVMRADRDDPEILAPADDFLEAVAERLG